MPIPTNTAEQYKRLRAILNPYIQGPNADAVLTALASGPASYLINNVSAVNDQLYIATASGSYLDENLAKYGITRPEALGLSDAIFSQIGIAVKNRKQVRDLINNLLDYIFGDEFVKASCTSSTFEPYNLNDGDTLTINFDSANTTTITFHASQFTNIHAATAQEVSDVISASMSSLGFTGVAVVRNNGAGNLVELLSGTIGPASSVTVLGGSAQNTFLFPAIVNAGGNTSTQWTLSLRPGGIVRFTWTAGANPQLGKVVAGDYVNIFGGGFGSSPNEGSYTIIDSFGGAVGSSYFDIQNPFGQTAIVTQGSDNAVLFYNPVKQTVSEQLAYAAVYQTQGRVLQVFLPATTKVIRRSRIGSAHIHYDPQGTYQINANPAPGDIFQINAAVSLVAGINFVIGANAGATAINLAAAVNLQPGLVATVDSTQTTDGDEIVEPPSTVLIENDFVSNSPLIITYTGSQNIVASGPIGDPISLEPNQQGPYSYDLAQSFTVSSVNTILAQELDATQPRVFQVVDSTKFPNSQGYLILNYGYENQEGPIPYISTPSADTILISPAYTLKNVFQPGTTVTLVAQKNPVVLTQDGTDYPFYVTDTVAGREYAQSLIQSVAATGINIIFTILYPGDIGLGKWGTAYSEITFVYGP